MNYCAESKSLFALSSLAITCHTWKQLLINPTQLSAHGGFPINPTVHPQNIPTSLLNNGCLMSWNVIWCHWMSFDVCHLRRHLRCGLVTLQDGISAPKSLQQSHQIIFSFIQSQYINPIHFHSMPLNPSDSYHIPYLSWYWKRIDTLASHAMSRG